MDYTMPLELNELKQAARQFVEENLLPEVLKYEDKSTFPLELFRKMGKEGFFKTHIPKELGGRGLGTLAFCIVTEEFGKAGFGMAQIPHFQSLKFLSDFGNNDQRERYFYKLRDGHYLGATAITESGVGSSFSNMRTRVEKKGTSLIINGEKTLINTAAEADIITVFAVSDEGLSALLVEKGTDGFRILKKLDPIGMRSSPIYDFEMVNCSLPLSQLVLPMGAGLGAFISVFNFSRLGNASVALGVSEAAFAKTITYLKSRQVGKQRAINFQGLRWMLAELSTELCACRLLRDKAALLMESMHDIGMEASQAKMYCVNAGSRIVNDCIQATGRFGCLRGNLFDVYLRDLKVLGIAGGSLEVMKNNIARQLLEV